MHPAIQAGRVAIITGSASGIGLAAARTFASKGLHVVLADLPTNLSTAAQSIKHDFPDIKVLPVETDVSQFSSLQSLKKKVDAEFKDVEVGVLMFNAGVGKPTATFARDGLNQETLRKNFETILDINLWGVINGVETFLPDLVKQKSPSAVICTGSKQVSHIYDDIQSRELQILLGIRHIIFPRRVSSFSLNLLPMIFGRITLVRPSAFTSLSRGGCLLYI
jgi:NAD(P)-dependent dehydrogenase (short-subunit alcohol dehydrogenase family)